MGAAASQTYKLKNTTGNFNANASKYTPEMIENFKEVIGDQLYYFGYSNHPEEENPTAAIHFDEHKEENLKQWMGFRQLNEG